MLFDTIRAELGNPNIYQVSREQLEQMESVSIKKPFSANGCWAVSSDYHPHIWISNGMSQKQRRNAIYHEMLHQLFPNARHWWITLAARRLAGGGHGEDGTELYDHGLDEIPPRDKLLKRVRRASKRFNEKRAKNESKTKASKGCKAKEG